MKNQWFVKGMRTGLLALAAAVAGGAHAEDLTIQMTKLPNGTVQTPYTATLAATGGAEPYMWTAPQVAKTREASAWATYGSAGEAMNWRENDGVWELAFPFDFPFYGKTYRTAYISSNGLVYFEGAKNTSSSLRWDNVGLTAFGDRDLSTLPQSCNIYVTTNSSEYVMIRWAAISSFDDGGPSAQEPTVNFAVVLFPDGCIRFTYGPIKTANNPEKANVFVGLKNKSESEVAEKYAPNDLSAAEDVVWRTAAGLPDGLTLATNGTLSGTPTTAGTSALLAQVTDATGATAARYIPFTIEENANEKPVVTSQSPAADGATVDAGDALAFAVTARDPEEAALSYTWKVNGVVTNTTSTAEWTWQTDPLDCGVYTVTCDISDGIWTVPSTWTVFVHRDFTWHVAAHGDDANDGRDAARPFKTIAQALKAAGDGETILVGPGTYWAAKWNGSTYEPGLCVTDGRRLTIRATVADPSQTILDGESKAGCLVLAAEGAKTLSTNVIVEGFTLRNGTKSGIAMGGGVCGGDLRHCVISNCVVQASGGGAAFAKLTDCTIVGCTAVLDGGGAYECELVRCIVRKNRLTAPSTATDPEGCGAGLAGGWASNTLIVENEIANTLKTGYGAGVCDTACMNCTIVANYNNARTAYGGVAAKNAQKPCVNTIVYSNQGRENNAIYGLADDLCDGTITSGLGLKFARVGIGDFRPAAGSTAIDAGSGRFAADATDLDGAARVQGWAVDCGAYEYKAGYAVTGDAETGFFVTPDADAAEFVASFPANVDATNVTIQVAPEIKTVTPNGAAVKVVRTTEDASYDITAFLDIPTTEAGVLDLASATVKAEHAHPLDVAKGANIDLRNPSAPSLTIKTQKGLRYTLREGKTLDAMENGVSTVGDGQPWTPDLAVRGGASGFYTIRVSK